MGFARSSTKPSSRDQRSRHQQTCGGIVRYPESVTEVLHESVGKKCTKGGNRENFAVREKVNEERLNENDGKGFEDHDTDMTWLVSLYEFVDISDSGEPEFTTITVT